MKDPDIEKLLKDGEGYPLNVGHVLGDLLETQQGSIADGVQNVGQGPGSMQIQFHVCVRSIPRGSSKSTVTTCASATAAPTPIAALAVCL